MTLVNITNENNIKFKNGVKKVAENRGEWDALVERINEQFNIVIKENLKNEFEKLYVFNSKERLEHKTNRHLISLFFGQHPTGEIEKEFDEFYKIKKHTLLSEKGGSLVFSEGIKGDVTVLIYPMSSENFKRKEDCIIADIYSDPKNITEKQIKRSIEDFFSYSQVSCIYGVPSYTDWLRVQWLILRDIRNREKTIGNIINIFYETSKSLLSLIVGLFLGIYSIKK